MPVSLNPDPNHNLLGAGYGYSEDLNLKKEKRKMKISRRIVWFLLGIAIIAAMML